MGARVRGCERRGHTVHSNSNSLSEELSSLGIASCLLCLSSCVLHFASCVVRPGTSKQSRNRSVLPCAGFSPPAVRDSRLDSSIQNRTRTRGRVGSAFSLGRSDIDDDNRTRARTRASVFITYPLPDSDATDPSQSAWARGTQRPNRTPNLDTRTSRRETLARWHWALATAPESARKRVHNAHCARTAPCGHSPHGLSGGAGRLVICVSRLATGDWRRAILDSRFSILDSRLVVLDSWFLILDS